MKVLHITRDFAPRDNGGLSRGVETMVRMAALARPDLEQAVLSFDGYRPRRAGPAELVVAKGPWGPEARLGGVGALADARDFARRFEPEVVHVHHAMLWPFAREALPAAPAVFGLHVLQRAMGRLRGVEAASESERLEAQALEEAAVITVPSVFCRSQLATTRAPVIVWPLAHHDTPEARAEAERDHPSGTPDRLLYVGRFADVKGIVELLAAALERPDDEGDEGD
ncbi:MAG: glycosyltransferase, partial [Myxococcales bacterium]|nr:glycosyltransferase [Myxococcales bacterium]